ncbi:CXC domain-containing protein [Cephalotus follicularis]|uniref:CXC domain-containing protein n=1 Tax=Cephalotus follicularis TaxID=3775 RepID=A0A1Q3BD73_CEPFO|nr:CXC domain-containing protein [Cephalotus follicularis]
MDSPEGDRIASTSSPASSPAVQESPFFNYLSNLSPIKSVKASRYAPRFSAHDFNAPSPVFTSPHIDLQRGSSLLKRDENQAAGPEIQGQSGRKLKDGLIASYQKEIQLSSPSSVCVDDYLADAVDLEDSINPANLCVQPTIGAPQFAKVEEANDNKTRDVVKTCSVRAEEDLTVQSMNMVETTDNQESYNEVLEFTSGMVNDNVESDIFQDPLSRAEHNDQYMAQNAGSQHKKGDGNCAERLREILSEPVKEANQHQCGTRRHLQFEAAMASKRTAICSSHNDCNLTHNTINSELPSGHANTGSLVPPHLSGIRHAVSYHQDITSQSCVTPPEFARSNQKGGNHSISSSVPSGIGLHLNTIGRSVFMGSDMVTSKKISGYLSSQDEKLMPGRSHDTAKDSDSTSILAVASEICVHVGDDQPGSQAALPTSSDISQSTKTLKSPLDSQRMTLYEQQVVQYEGKIVASNNADLVEELNQESPKKKRKKATDSSESDGCKRCNCKRSKCLKLYCECFAAGVYCVDSCACQNCFNKPEYEDTVLDTRQQIESRNPLAFAPKIVQHATHSSLVVDDGNRTTPSSARHKRGCNCKKSKCLKKYCECYQANVGCSDGCRCDSCCNPFGKKPESIYESAERWRNPSHAIKDGTTNQFSPTWEELADLRLLTPSSHPHLGMLASSSSANVRDFSKGALAEFQCQSSLQSSATYLRWHSSPTNLTPQHEFGSDSALFDILKDDNLPEPLKDSPTPTKAVKISSPNKKRVSPPQFRSQESRSGSSPCLRSGRKFILQAVPSFPPLTPYCNSKGSNTEIESDHLGSTSDQ